MKLQQFKYRLPEDRIALEPTPFRDDCRLMVVHAKKGVIEHHDSFRDVLDYFEEKDAYEICPVCGWEDDPLQRREPDLAGGANTLCLNDAIRKYNEESE